MFFRRKRSRCSAGFAVLVIASGIVVWAAGVKIARFSVAILLGLAVAALGAWLLPRFVDITMVTGGILGFVIGALTGAMAFRLLQGLILALCLGLAVGGIYYRWHITTELAASPTTAQVPASDLLIPTDRLAASTPPTTPTTPHSSAAHATPSAHAAPATAPAKAASHSFANDASLFSRSLLDHWNAIPPGHQKRLLFGSIGAAAIALLIAFGFPRITTWVISALIGALMILAGAHALLHVYAPQYESFLPLTTRMRYLTLGVLVLIGMGIQHRFFPRRKSKARAAPPADAAPVAAVPTA